VIEALPGSRTKTLKLFRAASAKLHRRDPRSKVVHESRDSRPGFAGQAEVFTWLSHGSNTHPIVSPHKVQIS
jgi:hypothetical protein